MRTAKKTSTGKTKTKAKAKTSKAVAKAKPRAAAKAKATARPKNVAAKSKAKARLKSKAAVSAKAKPRSKAAVSAKTKGRSKIAASAKAKVRPAPIKAQKPPPRRDASGRLDPKYARDLRALSKENHEESDDRAFFKEPRSGDDLAEELGEEAVGTMTSGEDQSGRLLGGEVEEERGGPFIKTRGGDEFAGGTDRSNPQDATREPFPRT